LEKTYGINIKGTAILPIGLGYATPKEIDGTNGEVQYDVDSGGAIIQNQGNT